MEQESCLDTCLSSFNVTMSDSRRRPRVMMDTPASTNDMSHIRAQIYSYLFTLSFDGDSRSLNIVFDVPVDEG